MLTSDIGESQSLSISSDLFFFHTPGLGNLRDCTTPFTRQVLLAFQLVLVALVYPLAFSLSLLFRLPMTCSLESRASYIVRVGVKVGNMQKTSSQSLADQLWHGARQGTAYLSFSMCGLHRLGTGPVSKRQLWRLPGRYPVPQGVVLRALQCGSWSTVHEQDEIPLAEW
jgi:hypothetical protein